MTDTKVALTINAASQLNAVATAIALPGSRLGEDLRDQRPYHRAKGEGEGSDVDHDRDQGHDGGLRSGHHHGPAGGRLAR
jgi:hypothetical protein